MGGDGYESVAGTCRSAVATCARLVAMESKSLWFLDIGGGGLSCFDCSAKGLKDFVSL